MVEIMESKKKPRETIEKRGEVMSAEEQKMKEEQIALKGQKIIKSGFSGKFNKETNFPSIKTFSKKEEGETEFEDNELDYTESQYGQQNKENEREKMPF